MATHTHVNHSFLFSSVGMDASHNGQARADYKEGSSRHSCALLDFGDSGSLCGTGPLLLQKRQGEALPQSIYVA